jgi:hypothetical protein
MGLVLRTNLSAHSMIHDQRRQNHLLCTHLRRVGMQHQAAGAKSDSQAVIIVVLVLDLDLEIFNVGKNIL